MSTLQAASTAMDGFGIELLLEVERLEVDHRYQRDLNELRVRQMTPFNTSVFGRLTVSLRSDGSLWVVDGQHRLAAAKRSGRVLVPCTVHNSWSLEDEAWVYEYKNRTQIKPSQYDHHKAAVLHKDPIALDIEEIVAEIGGKIGPRNNPATGTLGHISCIDSLRRIYGLKNEHGRYPIERYPKHNGREHLRRTLRIIVAAWSGAAQQSATVRPFHGDVIKGIATFLWYAQDDPNFDERKLIEALQRVAPQTLMQLGSRHLGISKPRQFATEVKALYNKVMSKKKLSEEWSVGDLPTK